MEKFRGVNLGGWLVTERWIAPSLYDGLEAQDEYSLCEELGENKDERLEAHRKTFITYDDFKWIREHGFDTVRIPVPHWVFGDVEPYVACLKYLDFAFEAALEHGLNVVIDLHTAPGSQNGEEHSGQKGKVEWHTDNANIEQTINLLDKLALRYGSAPNLVGLELLNEPSSKIPHQTLVDFYKQGYKIVRPHLRPQTTVIFNDAFRPMDWNNDFPASYKNIIMDMHLYQSFSNEDKKMNMRQHIQKAFREWDDLISNIQQNIPVMVGEWSLGLDNHALAGHDAYEFDLAMKAYAAAQIYTFDKTKGWFYWTYKTENMDGWSLQKAIQYGWIKAQ